MLRKSEKGWMFIEERVLEDFLWLHLESSLDLIPLKRQFIVKCYLWLPSPKNLFRPMKVSGVSRMNLYCGTDFLEISSVTPCTQDGRFAAGSSMAIDVYL